jgi:hypothetical protein
MKKLHQNGSNVVSVVVAIFVLGVVGFAGWRVFGSDKKEPVQSVNDGSSQRTSESAQTTTQAVTWQWDGSGWKASATAPDCKDPLEFTQTAVDTARIESILYPGQIRGGNYKPHGGFRLKSSNTADVKAITDGTVASGARYIEQGETQYMLTIVNDCGIAYLRHWPTSCHQKKKTTAAPPTLQTVQRLKPVMSSPQPLVLKRPQTTALT